MEKKLFLLFLLGTMIFGFSNQTKVDRYKLMGEPSYLVQNPVYSDGDIIDRIDSKIKKYERFEYSLSGKLDTAEKLYIYFLEYTAKQDDFEDELNKISEVSNSEKEEILNSLSKSFTSKWNSSGVEVIVSNLSDRVYRTSFNEKAYTNAMYYDDTEKRLYFNEDFFDFKEKEKITGSIAYANYDYFIFHNDEKWKKWDLSDIDSFISSNNKKQKSKSKTKNVLLEIWNFLGRND
ncbi:MAG: hypothetical protein KBF12_12880 [Sebaldella sp.]|nr:hypothetical protein [Sebaldella sp.]